MATTSAMLTRSLMPVVAQLLFMSSTGADSSVGSTTRDQNEMKKKKKETVVKPAFFFFFEQSNGWSVGRAVGRRSAVGRAMGMPNTKEQHKR